MNIAGRPISPGQPVYLIAEIGSNHCGSLYQAQRLIRTAAKCGADAVKFQYWSTADHMVLRSHPDYGQYARWTLPENWLQPMRKTADACHIPLFFSVFHPDDVPILESLVNPPAYKIASAELGYTALLEAVAKTGKPIIVSTGMATLAEISDANHALGSNPGRCVFLHCVSAYPAQPEDMNLMVFDEPDRGYTSWFAGLSDHTAEPFAAPIMAAALGACIVEKHFTLSREDPSPDAPFSVVPSELKQLATALHQAHLMLGDGVKRVQPSEQASLADKRTAEKGWLRG